METQDTNENKQTEKKLVNTEIPEYIEGVLTEKNASGKRREIIKDEYIRLIEKLQRENGKKAVQYRPAISQAGSRIAVTELYFGKKP